MSVADLPYRLKQSGAAALFAEAERQLNICNSCRYCEGYCAVYPALERRSVLTPGDISYLANLCHDCRACFYACMYAPPHEFAVDPPAILSEVRRWSYDEFTTAHWLRVVRDRIAILRHGAFYLLCTAVIALVVVLVAARPGIGVLYHHIHPTGSPYEIITYTAILIVSLVFFAASVLAMTLGALSYWRTTRGSLAGIGNLHAWSKAIKYASTLRYLRGGQEGCYLREDHPSGLRRALHSLVAYGFSLALVSTIVAAIEEDALGYSVPFSLWSVPVITGTVGGVGLVLGSLALLYVRHSEDHTPTDGSMTRRDRFFLIALLALGVTGLMTLGVRTTSIYGLVLAVHLITVWVCFLVAPMTKFVHLVYRMLALVQDNLESRAEELA